MHYPNRIGNDPWPCSWNDRTQTNEHQCRPWGLGVRMWYCRRPDDVDRIRQLAKSSSFLVDLWLSLESNTDRDLRGMDVVAQVPDFVIRFARANSSSANTTRNSKICGLYLVSIRTSSPKQIETKRQD